MEVDISDVIAKDFLKNTGTSSREDEDISDVIARNFLSKQKPENPEDNFNFPRYLGEQAADELIGLYDLPQIAAETIASGPRSPLMYPEYEQEYGVPLPEVHLPRTSNAIKRGMNVAGIDLNSQVPTTPEQRIAGKATRFGAGMLGGAGVGKLLKSAGAVRAGEMLGAPTAPTALGKTAQLSKNIGLGATAGGLSGAMEESGVPAPLSDLLGIVGTQSITGLPSLAKKTAKLPVEAYRTARASLDPNYAIELGKTRARKQLSHLEEQVASDLRHELGDDLPAFEEALRNYEPGDIPRTTAEATENLRLAQLQRAAQGKAQGQGIHKVHEEAHKVAREKIEGLGNEGASIHDLQTHYEKMMSELKKKHEHEITHANKQFEESLRQFSPQIEAEIPGEATQHFLKEKVKGIRRHAQKESKPHYEKAFEKQEAIETPSTMAYIKHLKEIEPDHIVKMVEKIEHDLSPIHHGPKLTAQEKESLARFRDVGQENRVPHLLEKERNSQMQGVLYEKADKVKQRINSMIKGTAPDDYNTRRILKDVLDRLENDISKSPNAPHLQKARETYREKIKEANLITESPVFKKVTEKVPGYSDRFKVYPSEVPKEFLKGNKSLDTSKELEAQIKNNKPLKGQYRGYANKIFMDEFSGKEITDQALNGFKKSYPGLFKLFPDFNTRLKNSQNANSYVNEVTKRNKEAFDRFYKESAKTVLEGDPDKVMNRILQGENRNLKVKEVMKNARLDETGGSVEGIRLATRDFIINKLSTGQEWTAHKYRNLMNTYEKPFQEIYDPDRMKVLKEVGKYYSEKGATQARGLATRSDTSANLDNKSILEGVLEVGGIEEYIKKVPGTKWFFKARNNIKQGKLDVRKEIIGNALAYPEYAKQIMVTPKQLSKVEHYDPFAKYFIPQTAEILHRKEEE